MKPVDRFFRNPSRKIGGAVVPVIGPPGSGKTNALIQMALLRKQEGHKIIWRGIRQGEWLKFLANGEEVVVWSHDSFNSVRVKVSDSSKVEEIDFEEIDEVTHKHFSDPKEVIENSTSEKINVVNIPGVYEKNEYRTWFTQKYIDLLKAIIERRNTYKFISFFADEGGDIWPPQSIAKNNLHSLVAQRSPPLLAQARKQNCMLYIAVHDVNDMHHMIYKVKANTIGYMQYSNVQKSLHPTVDQYKVNGLNIGQMIVPPKDKEQFNLAYEEDNIEWIGKNKDVDLEWDYDINLEDSDNDVEDTDIYKIGEVASKCNVSERTLRRYAKNGKINTVEVSGVKHTTMEELEKKGLLEEK